MHKLIVAHQAAFVCACPRSCCLNSAYGKGARQQLGLAWITAPWLDHCSSDIPPLFHRETHFLSFHGLLLTSLLILSPIPVLVVSHPPDCFPFERYDPFISGLVCFKLLNTQMRPSLFCHFEMSLAAFTFHLRRRVNGFE